MKRLSITTFVIILEAVAIATSLGSFKRKFNKVTFLSLVFFPYETPFLRKIQFFDLLLSNFEKSPNLMVNNFSVNELKNLNLII